MWGAAVMHASYTLRAKAMGKDACPAAFGEKVTTRIKCDNLSSFGPRARESIFLGAGADNASHGWLVGRKVGSKWELEVSSSFVSNKQVLEEQIPPVPATVPVPVPAVPDRANVGGEQSGSSRDVQAPVPDTQDPWN